jgi:hypothetical protein
MTSFELLVANRRYYKSICGDTNLNDMLAVLEVINLNDALAARD